MGFIFDFRAGRLMFHLKCTLRKDRKKKNLIQTLFFLFSHEQIEGSYRLGENNLLYSVCELRC